MHCVSCVHDESIKKEEKRAFFVTRQLKKLKHKSWFYLNARFSGLL